MKKIICTLLMCFITVSVFGVTLCKKTNTAVAVLRKSVDGTVMLASGTQWNITMDDGTQVKGTTVCTIMPGEYATVNTGVADTADEGVNCFCKMKQPASTYWVFLKSYIDNDACVSGCANDCAYKIASDLTFRSAVYESIW